MSVEFVPAPCRRCQHPMVLMRHTWGGQWVHVGTWRPWCDVPPPGSAGSVARYESPRVALLHAPDGAPLGP